MGEMWIFSLVILFFYHVGWMDVLHLCLGSVYLLIERVGG